jgi:hypothetical protein
MRTSNSFRLNAWKKNFWVVVQTGRLPEDAILATINATQSTIRPQGPFMWVSALSLRQVYALAIRPFEFVEWGSLAEKSEAA